MSSISVVLAVLLAALAASAGAQADERIVVTRDSRSLPSGCTPRETAELLVRLAEAVTAGDTKALDRLFAIEDPPGRHDSERAEPFFRWYSVGSTTLYDRKQLFPYFAERRRQNERWQLIAVDIGRSWIPGGAGIGYAIRRTANDLPGPRPEFTHGKGEIDCAAQRIYVWSMAQGDGSSSAQPRLTPCPTPPGWSPGTPIVACSRSSKPDTGSGRTARAMLPDFYVDAGSGKLPRLCGPAVAVGKLRSALSAFNVGRGGAFAKHFAGRGLLHPYTATEQRLLGQTAIARFADARHARGDGWTGASLRAPVRATFSSVSSTRRVRVGVYLFRFRLTSPGELLVEVGSKVVFECLSGLIRRWVGPAVAAP